MSPSKKTTAKKSLERQRHEKHQFKNKDALEAFMDFYKEVAIIVEREMDIGFLENTSIPNVFKDRT